MMNHKCTCGKELKEYNGFSIYDNIKYRYIDLCSKCFMEQINTKDIYYCEYHRRFEIHDKREAYIREKRGYVCQSAYDMLKDDYDYSICEECGILFNNDARTNLCNDCSDNNIVRIAERVECYHNSKKYKPVFYGNPINGIYFGMEIESEYKNPVSEDNLIASYPQRMREICDFERDGSLCNGFETITSPLSYEFIKNNDIIQEITSELKEDMKISSRCGLHIHVTKTDKVIEKLPYLIMFFENNKQDIKRLAQRNYGHYCETYVGREEKINLEEANLIIDLRKVAERYRTINLMNENTIEFRVFKGTLSPKRIISYIQFILTLLEMDINEDTNFQDLVNNVTSDFTELLSTLGRLRFKKNIIVEA